LLHFIIMRFNNLLLALLFVVTSLFCACTKTGNPSPNIVSGAPSGQFIASVNGQPCVFNAVLTRVGNRISIIGSDSVAGRVQGLEIFTGATTPGTYALGKGTPSDGNLGVYQTGSNWISIRSTFNTNLIYNGTLTIDAIDTIQKSISGTFNFLGADSKFNGSNPTFVTITNGIFINLKWQ